METRLIYIDRRSKVVIKKYGFRFFIYGVKSRILIRIGSLMNMLIRIYKKFNGPKATQNNPRWTTTIIKSS